MKKLGLLMLISALGVWGCVTVDNSTIVDADTHGYATGQYRDVRHGKVADFGVFATGAGGAASAASSSALAALTTATSISSGTANKNDSSSGGGGGMLGLRVYPAPTQGNPLPFARSIAMINYSKKLTRVTYDDSGLVNYEFGEPGQKSPPSSFGYKPVQ
jgi:hypothetical protein